MKLQKNVCVWLSSIITITEFGESIGNPKGMHEHDIKKFFANMARPDGRGTQGAVYRQHGSKWRRNITVNTAYDMRISRCKASHEVTILFPPLPVLRVSHMRCM